MEPQFFLLMPVHTKSIGLEAEQQGAAQRCNRGFARELQSVGAPAQRPAALAEQIDDLHLVAVCRKR